MNEYVTYQWLLTFLGGTILGLIVLFSTMFSKKVDSKLCDEMRKNFSDGVTKIESTLKTNSERLHHLELGQGVISGKLDILIKRSNGG